jgi:hypothetical protein
MQTTGPAHIAYVEEVALAAAIVHVLMTQAHLRIKAWR